MTLRRIRVLSKGITKGVKMSFCPLYAAHTVYTKNTPCEIRSANEALRSC